MKIRTLLLGVAGLFAVASLSAQTIVQVPAGEATLETTINADTTADGSRNDPNTIYELVPGAFYMMNSGIKFTADGGMLTIRMQADAPADSKKPVIVRSIKEGTGIDVSSNSVQGSLTLENVHYQTMEMTTNQLPWAAWAISGDGHSLTVDGCLVEFANGIIFNLNSVPSGAKISIMNTYFRDLNNFAQWWQARVVQAKVPVDEFLFENNTVSGGGLTILGQSCLFEYAVINHNTFINNHKYPMLNTFYKEGYFTNNLFVNANMVGEDAENVAVGGQDPDGRAAKYTNADSTEWETFEMYHGISGIDTVIAKQISIQAKFYNADSTLTDDIDEISDYIFYCADNVVVSSATLDDYYAGETGNWTGVLESMLTWGGVGTAPFAVENAPGMFTNSRTDAMAADWDNIKYEDNHIYDMTAAALVMATEALPQDAADVFAQWNQNAWGVTDAAKPTDFSAYYFGDYDPNTIPGPEGEDGTGISKISDLPEDFSYTADVKSTIDGLNIGATHWDDIDYDSEMLTAKVKAAYNGTLGIEDAKRTASSQFKLSNYPNPFVSSTTISFNLVSDSHVTLSVYDISGRVVAELINENRVAGEQSVVFAPDYSASSTYFFKLTTDFGSETRKMMLLK